MQGWANEMKPRAKAMEECSAVEPMAVHVTPTIAHHFRSYLLLQYLPTEMAPSHMYLTFSV